MVCSGMFCSGMFWYVLVWFVLVCFGMVYSGMLWYGLFWYGLFWYVLWLVLVCFMVCSGNMLYCVCVVVFQVRCGYSTVRYGVVYYVILCNTYLSYTLLFCIVSWCVRN